MQFGEEINHHDLGNLPNGSEPFSTVRKDAERKENHTLTVKEVARMFEAAGVARTERSIVNRCQPNRTGKLNHNPEITPQLALL